MLRWKNTILESEKYSGKKNVLERRRFNRMLLSGGDKTNKKRKRKVVLDLTGDGVVETNVPEKEDGDSGSEINKARAAQRRRYEQQQKKSKDETRKKERRIRRLKIKAMKKLTGVSQRVQGDGNRPLWTQEGNVVDLYENMALDELTIEAFVETLIGDGAKKWSDYRSYIAIIEMAVDDWLDGSGGFAPKLSNYHFD